jgi:hypothetical protein
MSCLWSRRAVNLPSSARASRRAPLECDGPAGRPWRWSISVGCGTARHTEAPTRLEGFTTRPARVHALVATAPGAEAHGTPGRQVRIAEGAARRCRCCDHRHRRGWTDACGLHRGRCPGSGGGGGATGSSTGAGAAGAEARDVGVVTPASSSSCTISANANDAGASLSSRVSSHARSSLATSSSAAALPGATCAGGRTHTSQPAYSR